jgi:hypothetical protein
MKSNKILYYCCFAAFLLPTATLAWLPAVPIISHKDHISSYPQRLTLTKLYEQKFAGLRTTPSEEERPHYYEARPVVDPVVLLQINEADKRGTVIIETEEQLEIKEKMLREIVAGIRPVDEEFVDPEKDLIFDEEELGRWTIRDVKARFDYEWDPFDPNDLDPNIRELNLPGVSYVEETEKDDDGVEVGYDPIFGPSNPVDRRAIKGMKDSFMIDEATRDERMLEPQFAKGDPELAYNEQVVKFRKSLDLMETNQDEFLPDMVIPRHVAKWHGYPEQENFEPKNFTNNRFTENPTDFNKLTPYRARQLAVEMARSRNAEWLPNGVSQKWHKEQREPYEKYQTLVGTLRKGECDEAVVEQIRPVLETFGSCAKLLSIDEGVFRFHYFGLIKNKFGMAAWMEKLLKNAGVEVTGVVFECGFRKRDPSYDGGDPFFGYIG